GGDRPARGPGGPGGGRLGRRGRGRQGAEPAVPVARPGGDRPAPGRPGRPGPGRGPPAVTRPGRHRRPPGPAAGPPGPPRTAAGPARDAPDAGLRFRTPDDTEEQQMTLPPRSTEHAVVVDLGFGDAGKGAVVDLLCARQIGRASCRGILQVTIGSEVATTKDTRLRWP